jgi:hypothetical protein
MPIAIHKSSRMATNSHSVSEADLEILSLLTSDESSLGPLPSRPNHHKAKRLPRRESPMDALLISAVLSGSGPLTRHHIGHGASKPFSTRRPKAVLLTPQHDQEHLPHAMKNRDLHPRPAPHTHPLCLCEVCKRLGANVSEWSRSSPPIPLQTESPKIAPCRKHLNAREECRSTQHHSRKF